MLNQRILGLHKLVLTAQVLMALGLFATFYVMLVVDVDEEQLFGLRQYSLYAMLTAAALIFEASVAAKASEPFLEKSTIYYLQRAFRQTLYVVGAITFFLFLTKDATISRPFLVAYSGVLFGILYFSHDLLPSYLSSYAFGGQQKDRAILIGPVQNAQKLRKWLGKQSHLGFETVGLITDDNTALNGFRTLGSIDQTASLLKIHRATLVILTELPFFSQFNRHLISICENLGVRLLIYSDLQDKLGFPVQYFADGEHRFFTLREEPLENAINAWLKRALDVIISLPVCLILLPVISVFVAVLHRLQSPGPLLYHQQRAGIQNRTFVIKKYRTMHVHNQPESQQATVGDKRIFPAGALLRKLSIDELPQFLNVLSGEMSIVGPRPHLIEHNKQFAKVLGNYQIRTLVKPGITGLAQVRGFRGEAKEMEDILRRVRADIEYLENWRLSMELGIIWGTFMQIFRPPSTAY